MEQRLAESGSTNPLGWLRPVAGLGVWVTAFSFYILLTPAHPQAWDWSAALVAILGLDPFRPLSHPIWQFIVSGLNHLAGPRLVPVAGWLSALIGSLCVWLVFQIAARIPFDRPAHGANQAARPRPVLGVAAGLVAALYAAISMPLLVVSTRVHPLGLSALLLLLAIYLMVQYRETQRLRYWYTFALVLGLGMVEFATFLLAAPLMLLSWGWMLWRSRQLKPAVGLAAVPLLLVGLAVGAVFCWLYFHQPVAEWREFRSPWMVGRYFITDQINEVLHSVPRLGWLVVFLFMVVPALQVLVARHETDEDLFTRLGLYAFRLVMASLAVLPLLDLSSSPWRLAGLGTPLLTPYLMTAIWVGHMAGFWLGLLAGDFETSRLKKVAAWRSPVRILGFAALVAGLGWTGWRHSRMVDPRPHQPVVDFARAIVDSLDGRTYLLTDGTLDPLIQLTARASGKDVHLMNRRYSQTPSYLRYLATWFSDAERQSIARIGLQPLLDTWLARDPETTGTVAVLEYPDAWVQAGYLAVPRGALYVGAATSTPPDARVLFTEQMQFFQDQLDRLPPTNQMASLVGSQRDWLASHLSRMANNLGVLLEDAGQRESAWAAYQMALKFVPLNISALLNLYTLGEREQRPGADEIKNQIQAFTDLYPGGLVPWALSVNFGYVRSPEIYLQEGLAWAMSGRPAVGLRRMRRALDVNGESPGVRLAVAGLMAAESADESSAELYRSILRDDPTNRPALMGLARVGMSAGRVPEVRDLLDRLIATGVKPEEVALEQGLLLIMEGKADEARRTLERSMRGQEEDPRAWMGLVTVARETKDERLFERALERLKSFTTYVPGLIFLHGWAMSQNDLTAARRYIELADRQASGQASVKERVISLDLYERKYDLAWEHAREMLTLDPLNAIANYAGGVVLHRRGQLEEAALYFRRSVARAPWPQAINDLAWTLYELGRFEEARTLAQQAVDVDPAQPLYWGTLGMSRFKLGDVAGAVADHEKALALDQRLPILRLHLAELYLAQGRVEPAQRLLDALKAEQAALSREVRGELERLLSGSLPRSKGGE